MPSIEQIEDQIAQEANATRLAREKAEQHKAETEQQIRLEQQRQADAAAREDPGTLEAQGGDDVPVEPADEADGDREAQQQQEAIRQQAWRALQAQQAERAEAEALAAAEEARAADILRQHKEAAQQMGRHGPPEPKAASGAKHAHDGDTQGSKGPKIPRATQGEAAAAEADGNTDAAHSTGKAQGKGKPCVTEENMPY